MAVKSIEEILTQFQTVTKDDTRDETIGLLEDVSDTLRYWEGKHLDTEKEWRERYKERFFKGESVDLPAEVKVTTVETETEEEPPKEGLTYEKLFEEKEGK